jgi:CcmD family protein
VSHTTVMALIMAVPLITWLGVFAYLVNIDRSLRRIELSTSEKEQDDL